MAIAKGTLFSSYEEFQVILKTHEDECGVLYVKEYSKKLRDESPYLERLQYEQIKFACKQGCRRRKSSSQGIRPNQKTLKAGCPAFIRLAEDRATCKLKVSNCHLVHENHPTGQEFAQLYPENRRPNMSSELKTLLSLKSVSVRDIQNIVRQNYGKIILRQDVWNLKNKLYDQMDESLIQCVQKYRVLYDTSDPKFSNRDSTQKAWAEVAADLNETADVVETRWTYLRKYFQKQHIFSESLKPEEWSAKKKKWSLYDSLTFLLPYIEFGNTTGSDGVSETHQSLDSSDDVSEESVSVTFDNQLADSVKKQQDIYLCQQPSRKRTMNELDQQFFSAPKEQHHEEDDHEHFLKSLLPMMRALDSLAAMEFRHEVQGLLIKYMKKAHMQEMPSQSSSNPP